MIEVARRSWAAGRRWTPGEIAWAARTGDGSDQVAFMGDGFCWQQPDYAVIVATNFSLILQLAQPYVGDVSTASDSLKEVVAVLSQPVP